MSAASLAQNHINEQLVMDAIQSSLTWATGNAATAKAEARRYKTAERWSGHLRNRISGAAFGAAIIPGLNGFGLALELPYLLRLMGRGAIGTGELIGATIDPEADFPAILAHWSGAIDQNVLAAAAGGVVIVDGIAYHAFGAKVLALGFKIGVKAAAAEVGGVTGMAINASAGPVSHMLQPIFGKVLGTLSAKVSALIGAKAFAGLVPLVGAGVGVAISRHILGDFLASARLYYKSKLADV
jgi:hypothetical protein